jgi:hypothetical protein
MLRTGTRAIASPAELLVGQGPVDREVARPVVRDRLILAEGS